MQGDILCYQTFWMLKRSRVTCRTCSAKNVTPRHCAVARYCQAFLVYCIKN